ncbi:B30.2/SPRY domain-containing protein [Entamoeba marina]
MNDADIAIAQLGEAFQQQFMYFNHQMDQKDQRLEALENTIEQLAQKDKRIEALEVAVERLSRQLTAVQCELEDIKQSKEIKESVALSSISEEYKINTPLEKSESETWRGLLGKLKNVPFHLHTFVSSGCVEKNGNTFHKRTTQNIILIQMKRVWTQQPNLAIYRYLDSCAILESDYYYYEATILPSDAYYNYPNIVSVGLIMNDKYSSGSHVGWRDGSVAIHSDDGKLFNSRGSGEGPGYPFGPSDVVGCGWNWKTGMVFFTINGQLIHNIKTSSEQYIPAIGLERVGPLEINSGDKPFVFDIVQYFLRV